MKAFSSCALRCGVELRNRIVMAPMTRRCAPNGIVTPEVSEYYARRAAGGVGLIITEGVHVNATDAVDALNSPRCITNEQVAAWKRVTESCRAASDGRVVMCMQLWHTGIFSLDPIGPSNVDASTPQRKVGTIKEATDLDIDRIASEFAETAFNAVHKSGFDMVQIHGAHGYFVDSFTSPKLNVRSDKYGVDTCGRSQVAVLIAAKVREAVGPKVPISFRFSQWLTNDYGHKKFTSPEELSIFVHCLAKAGVDIIDVSTRRVLEPAFPEVDPKLSLAGWTRKLLRDEDVLVCGVGSVAIARSYGEPAEEFLACDPRDALDAVDRGEFDLLAVGRGLIADVNWVDKVSSGNWTALNPYSLALLTSLQ